MTTKFRVKRSTVSGITPTTVDIDAAELAINIPDRKLFTSNGTAVFELGSNLASLQVGNSSVRQTVNSSGIFVSGIANVTGNVVISGALSSANVTASIFTGNVVGTAANATNLNNQPASFYTNATNLTTGTLPDARLSSAVVNTSGAFTIGGNITYNANLTIASTGELIITNGAGIIANGTLGTAGQILTTNGTSVYWSSAGVNTAAQYAWTNTHSYAANLTILGTSELIIANGAGIEANGSLGASGLVLTSNGTGVYWASTAASVSEVVTQQFTANGTANSFLVTGGYFPNAIEVYLAGVKQVPGTDVTITSGSTVNFTVPPLNGQVVDVFGYKAANNLQSISAIVSQQFTANGTANTFTITPGYIPNAIEVYVSGVKRIPGTDVDISSGSTISFTVPPLNGQVVDVFGYRSVGAVAPFVDTAGGTMTGNLTLNNASLVFSGTGNRIRGDFSNATIASRTIFQSSVTNGATGIIALPNGTATDTAWRLYNSSDTLNASIGDIAISPSTFSIRSFNTGTGTFLPMAFSTGGSERMRIAANGNVGIGTSSPAHLLDVSGSGTQTVRAITTDTSGIAVGRFMAQYAGGGGGTASAIDIRAGDGYSYIVTTTNTPMLFGTNGSERMRIDNAGRVSINDSGNSFHRLVVREDTNSGASALFRAGSNTAFAGLTFERTRAGNASVQNSDNLGNIQFAGWDGSTGTGQALITATVDGTVSTGSVPTRMNFATTPAGSLVPLERMRIDANGNVGIGVSNPTYRLSTLFAAGTQSPSALTRGAVLATSYTRNDNSEFVSRQISVGATQFVTFAQAEDSALNAMPLAINPNGGNVGIGTSSPGVPLDVSSTTVPQIKVARPAGIDMRLNAYYGSADLASLTVVTNHPLSFHTNNTERMRITAAGLVGIGTNNPTERLFVSGGNIGIERTASDYSVLTINNTSGVNVHLNANGNTEGNLRTVTNHPLSFSTNNTERMRITANGDVGIGTSTPGSRLQVNGQARFFPSFSVFSINETYTSSGWFGTSGIGFNVERTGANTWTYYSDTANAGGALIDCGIGGDLRFFTRDGLGNTTNVIQTDAQMLAQERMRITRLGNVGIGVIVPTLNTNGTVLHIHNGTASRAAVVHMTNAETGSASNDGLIVGKWSDGINFFLDYDNFPIVLGTGGAERMRIDASGNVGIGTSTPGLGLGVFRDNGNGWAAWIGANTGTGRVGLGTQAGIAAIQGFNSSGNAADLILNPNGGSVRVGAASNLGNSRLDVDTGITARTAAASGVTPYLQLLNGNAGTDLKTWRVGATSAGGFAIETVNDAYTAATQRMLIDANGRVIRPQQPAFAVWAGSGITTTGSYQVCVFNSVTTNVGSHYNTSNGRFTAPVTGIYHFTWFISQSGTATGPVSYLFVNGNAISYAPAIAYGTAYNNACASVTLSLNANDFVDVRVIGFNNSFSFVDFGYSGFSGFLI